MKRENDMPMFPPDEEIEEEYEQQEPEPVEEEIIGQDGFWYNVNVPN